ncbi:MAG TPA: GatB/YqeY domain-containing protein [Gammaproteobacteria bacterium]|jgi:uncharacterized protein YqeY|nr:GatB/YqeY domain-containing protein [Gammaproteobacteria bacterium]
MTTIKDRILEDMKAAMRSQEKERLATIRLIMAAMKQREVDERIELTDEDVLAILNKMIKQRRDSIAQFQAGARQDLADKELAEVAIIQHYLPAQLTDAEIEAAIEAAIQSSGASSAKDMGKVMGLLKATLAGKAEMTAVSAKVKTRLAE